jgi:hypothetical protein
LLGRLDEAEERLRTALAEHLRLGASFWLATTAIDLTEVLLAGGGDNDEMRALVNEARQLAAAGYGDVLSRADAVAARLDATN